MARQPRGRWLLCFAGGHCSAQNGRDRCRCIREVFRRRRRRCPRSPLPVAGVHIFRLLLPNLLDGVRIAIHAQFRTRRWARSRGSAGRVGDGDGDQRRRPLFLSLPVAGGIAIWAAIAIAFVGFAASTMAFYSGGMPPLGLAAIAAFALGIGGFAPGALYAAAPRAAPFPQSVPPTIGLLQRASNLGQFAGPIAVGAWAQHFGWAATPMLAVPAALLGLVGAWGIRSTQARVDKKAPESRRISVDGLRRGDVDMRVCKRNSWPSRKERLQRRFAKRSKLEELKSQRRSRPPWPRSSTACWRRTRRLDTNRYRSPPNGEITPPGRRSPRRWELASQSAPPWRPPHGYCRPDTSPQPRVRRRHMRGRAPRYRSANSCR